MFVNELKEAVKNNEENTIVKFTRYGEPVTNRTYLVSQQTEKQIIDKWRAIIMNHIEQGLDKKSYIKWQDDPNADFWMDKKNVTTITEREAEVIAKIPNVTITPNNCRLVPKYIISWDKSINQ